MIDCPDCGDPYPPDQLDGHQIEDHPAHFATIAPPNPARVERIMRWLNANGATHTANQILDSSIWTDGHTIHYDVWVVGLGRHHVTMPQHVDCHDANTLEDTP